MITELFFYQRDSDCLIQPIQQFKRSHFSFLGSITRPAGLDFSRELMSILRKNIDHTNCIQLFSWVPVMCYRKYLNMQQGFTSTPVDSLLLGVQLCNMVIRLPHYLTLLIMNSQGGARHTIICINCNAGISLDRSWIIRQNIINITLFPILFSYFF